MICTDQRLVPQVIRPLLAPMVTPDTVILNKSRRFLEYGAACPLKVVFKAQPPMRAHEGMRAGLSTHMLLALTAVWHFRSSGHCWHPW